jgi:UDP:flavonoid glycosyltransferase YjiC (YdhE family)
MDRIWQLARRHTLPWVQDVLHLRRELGLPSGGHPLFDGCHSPQLVLALFSPHLAATQPDWPRNTVVTGFPIYDSGDLPPHLLAYLSEGAAPVVFTLGSSAVAAAGDFYVESLAAVQRLGCRAVFLTGSHPQGLPDRLPPNVLAVDYAPHGPLFARAAAIVHQGGIGTTAQAMRSGHPQLFTPFGHDQFDNADRVRRLGAAAVVHRANYRARRVAAALQRLLQQPRYAQATAELGEKVRAENGAVAAADAIEQSLR